MTSSITLTMAQFVWLMVFAVIGVLVSILFFLCILLYFVCGVRDMTYYDRHKKEADKCPDYVESEEDKK